jgi:hypothetical protein
MSESGFGTYIGLNCSMIVSLARALIDTGMLSAADFASACRTTAENMPDDGVRRHLLAFAETLEEAEARADRLLAPSWTPKVVPGGKDDGNGGA